MDRVTQLKQELFNEIWAKASEQKFEPSFLESNMNTCAYRGSNGRCCNVGHLIPDERYISDIEGNVVDGMNEVFVRTTAYDRCVAGGFDEHEIRRIGGFLRQCQAAHDDCASSSAPPAKHRRLLQEVAELAGLTIPAEVAA